MADTNPTIIERLRRRHWNAVPPAGVPDDIDSREWQTFAMVAVVKDLWQAQWELERRRRDQCPGREALSASEFFAHVLAQHDLRKDD